MEIDLEKYQNAPIDAFDFQFMIGDVKDFLEFSESNIDWQHRRELQAIAHRKDLDEFPPEYQDQLEQGAEHRFKVSLPLRVRYGALLAFTTSVEWAVNSLNRTALAPVSDERDRTGTNFTVRVLREFSSRATADPGDVIETYEALVQIRNCIAHSAGLVATYRFKDALPVAVSQIPGIGIGDWHFSGDHICIERGALEPHMDKMARFVITLHTAMHGRGLLKRRPTLRCRGLAHKAAPGP